MIDEEKVWQALSDCYDPEIPINIVDLGLVYDVKVVEDSVNIKMTLTAPGCPMHSVIAQDVRAKVSAIEGAANANVDVGWDPPWNPSMMSKEGKVKLGFTE